MKMVILSMLLLLLGIQPVVYAGVLDEDSKFADKPVIMVGEIYGYGDYSLRQEFFDTLEELMQEQLQETKKFRIADDSSLQPVPVNGVLEEPATALSHIHMNAIARGHCYLREQSSVGLIRYTDALYGRRFAPESDNKGRRIGEKPKNYALSSYLQETLRAIRHQQNIKYLLFCNMKQANASVQGKKINVNIDYYLVNTENGLVYEGTSFADKSTNMFNLVVVKYGKDFTIQQLLHDVLERQAKRIAEDIGSTGQAAIRSGKGSAE